MYKKLLTIERLRSVIRAYDIRGRVPDSLSTEEAYLLGVVLSSYFESLDVKLKVVIGMDNRLSSKSLKRALIEGLISNKVEIIDLGLIMTPQLYHAALTDSTHKLGIMVTASHNPPDYNGFKIVWQGEILDGQALKELLEKFAMTSYQASSAYFDWLMNQSRLDKYQPQQDIKIIWDCNYGATQAIIQLIQSRIVPDSIVVGLGDYILQDPNPSNQERIDFILQKLIAEKCDFAFCFDGDGDRLLMITKSGKILRGDQILLLLCKYFYREWSGQVVVVDIKTSPQVVKTLTQLGYKVVLEKTGHSFIKQTMLAEKAQIGGEVSGHIFFTYNNYPYDDALLAALLLLEMFLQDQEVFQSLLEEAMIFPSLYDFKIVCQESLKMDYLARIIQVIQDEDREMAFYLDGIKYIDDEGSWLLRASNTEEAIILCLEGYSQEFFLSKLEDVKKVFYKAGLQGLFPEVLDKKNHFDNSLK
jgi:phosphomannomutase